jgi:hypothetical protein
VNNTTFYVNFGRPFKKTRPCAGGSRNRARLPVEVHNYFLLLKAFIEALTPFRLLITVHGGLFLKGKNGRAPDTDPLLPCGAEDKNSWSYTSSSPYTFMVYTWPISLLTEKENVN